MIKLIKQLNYVLIKYPYLIEKEINDIDVLLSDKDYYKARKILKRAGFKVTQSEFKEKYKTMLSFFDGKQFVYIHLHRQIAWNGIIALDKDIVLQRKRKFKDMYVPSYEDSFLINAVHVLLELQRMRNYEKKLFSRLQKMKLDTAYMDEQLVKNGWKEQFEQLLHNTLRRGKTLTGIMLKKPYLLFNFFGHYFKWIFGMLIPSRKLCIALLGPDGSGKSTIADRLRPYNFSTIYGGWKHHILPTSRLLAAFGRTATGKKKRQQFKEKREKKIGFIQELVYLNYVFEHLTRYVISFFIRFRHHIVFDRYFTDVVMQDKNAEKSLVVRTALWLFPRPTYMFYLYGSPKILVKRKKQEKLKIENIIFQQKQLRNIDAIKINSEKGIEDTVHQILSVIWRKI